MVKINMKKLIAIILISPLAFSQGIEYKPIDFALSCKVTDQVLIATEDGIAKRYSNYEGSLKAGDAFEITFKFRAVNKFYRLDIKAEALSVRSFIRSDATRPTMVGNGVWFEERPYDITFTEDLISADGMLGDFVLDRYYKNDWDFMASEGASPATSRTLVANCMGMPKEYDEMLKIMAEMEGDKWFDDGFNID